MRRRAQAGFTLLELLVAIAIFAVLSVLAYGGLTTVLNTREAVDQEAARLAALQSAWAIIERDIQQMVPRPIRDEYGDAQPALIGAELGNRRLELTRAGYRSPAPDARSSLQRVGYELEDEVLYRVSWRALDRAQDSTPERAVLLAEVSDIQVRFLDADMEWRTAWPPLTQPPADPRTLPRAVEVSLDLLQWGRITRLFALPRAP